jgi:hypothetical protein
MSSSLMALMSGRLFFFSLPASGLAGSKVSVAALHDSR